MHLMFAELECTNDYNVCRRLNMTIQEVEETLAMLKEKNNALIASLSLEVVVGAGYLFHVHWNCNPLGHASITFLTRPFHIHNT